MNTIVWIMVMVNFHNAGVTTGAEFTSQTKCERAAEAIAQAANDVRWGMRVKAPICVRIVK
jgi:succinyl-CoA synthetase beta subunit